MNNDNQQTNTTNQTREKGGKQMRDHGGNMLGTCTLTAPPAELAALLSLYASRPGEQLRMVQSPISAIMFTPIGCADEVSH